MQRYFFIAIMLLCFGDMLANNIRVTNVSLTEQNTNSNSYKVNFSIAWDNSWRTSTNESNWDAAWIFIKYRPLYSTEWRHAKLLRTNLVFNDETIMEVKPSTLGAIIERGVDGSGNVSYENAFLTWTYGNEIGDNDKIEIAVFAIEMVYVPQGTFSAGDGRAPTSNGFHQGQPGTQDDLTVPFTITSESQAINLGGTNSINLSAGHGFGEDFNDSTSQSLPTAFPKGYAGFYCMKYECSMGQYTEFLNKLTPLQASVHLNATTDFGYTIATADGRIYTTSTPERACNFISFADSAAYAEWAGMRMMTELEYEKSCRGGLTPVPGEQAWGNANICLIAITGNAIQLINAGTEDEVLEEAGLCNTTDKGNLIFFDYWDRPLRCGIVAASSPIKTRIYTGGSYYGIMEMSGNVGELCVGLSESLQRAFTNAEGDGKLSADGQPSFNPPFCCVRGATRYNGFNSVSSRSNSQVMFNSSVRSQYVGFRCVLNN